MSAWLVSKLHIDALVYARSLIRHPSRGLRSETIDSDLGRMLWRENMLSLAGLYEKRHGDQVDEAALADYTYSRHGAFLGTPVIALIKAIDCYEYQSCEHQGWEKSDAFHYCKSLRSALIHLLPGWEEAPWGIDSLPIALKKQ